MTELSEPAHLTDMAVEIGIERGDWGSGKSSVFLNIESKHCNKGGVAHGGLYTMMLDMALGGALVSILPKQEWCATTQLSISFISAARPGEKITAHGNVVKRGKNVAHLDGKIIADSGRVIASATGTWAIWDHKPASMS
ncbi:MAG: PaaI family thioesterase [Candidatus Poseidoniaceae archaeon]